MQEHLHGRALRDLALALPTGQAEGLDLEDVSRTEFGEEETAYARRLSSTAGGLPVYTTPAESDLYESSLEAFGRAFEGFGAAPTQVVHQCGSGVTACHNLLAMEHAGLSGSRLYPGSWSEWCADPARPVARG